MGRGVEVEMSEVEEARSANGDEIRKVRRELGTLRKQTKHAQISAGIMLVLSVLMFIGVMIIPLFMAGAPYSYVDDQDSYLNDRIKSQQSEIAELARTLAETQTKLQVLLDDAAEKCIADFTEEYVASHPYLIDSEDPYISLLLEGVRIQAQAACSWAT